MEKKMSDSADQNLVIQMPSEKRYRAFFALLVLLFAAEGFNFFSYPLLGISAISVLYCFYNDGLFLRLKKNPAPLFLPLALFAYTAISPGYPLKDLPVADKMLAAFVTGLGAASFLPGLFPLAMLALPVAIAVSCLIWFFSGFSDSYFLGERLVLFLGNPNKLSFVASFAIVISVVIRQNLSGFWRNLNRIALTFCILTVILTSSRASILGLLACVVFWTATILRKRLGRIILLLLMAFLGAFWCLPDCEVERLRMAADPVHDTAFQKRLFIWGVALKGISDAPLLGNSIRGFRQYYGRYLKENEKELAGQPFFEEDIFDVSHPHNIFLGIAFGYGLVGSILLLGTFVSALKQAVGRSDYLLFSALLFNMVSGLFEFYLHRVSGALFLFFPLGITYGMAYLEVFRSDSGEQVPNDVPTALSV